VHRADARTGEHRKHRLGHVGHVDDHAVALPHTQVHKHRGKIIHLAVQLAIGELTHAVGLAGSHHQRQLIATLLQMAVNRVETQVGAATDKPLAERRIGVIQNLLRRRFPVDQPALLFPELFRLFDGKAMQLLIAAAKRE